MHKILTRRRWEYTRVYIIALLLIPLVVAITACESPAPEPSRPVIWPTVPTKTPIPSATDSIPIQSATPRVPRATPAVYPTPTPTSVVVAKPTATHIPILIVASVDTTRPVSSELEAIDHHALDAPDSIEGSIATLAAYLVRPAETDVERARALYRWITEHISYDFEGFLSEVYGNQSATAVLKRRTAVCEGYANLYAALAKEAGLEVVVIGGWSKGYGFVTEGLGEETNHAWNAVKIGNGWHLIESTWGAGHISEDEVFVRDFDDFYFMVPPEQLIFSHFPEEARWQLLGDYVSRSEFESLPRVQPPFFENNLGIVSHPAGTIRTQGEVSVTLSAPEDVLVSARVDQGDAKLADEYTFTQRDHADYVVRAVFPSLGEYELVIYAKTKEDEGSYSSAVAYTVSVSQGLPDHTGYPMTYGKFGASGSYLYEPLSGQLERGDTVKFSLRVPGAEKVAVIMGEQWNHLELRDEIFQGEVTIAAPEITVGANFPGSTMYSSLLRFTSP